MAFLDFPGGAADSPRSIVEQYLLLRRRHQAEQRPRLRVVVIVDPMIPVIRHAFQRQRRFGEIRLFLPFAFAVGLIADRSAGIAIDPHAAIAMVAVEWALGRIHRNLMVIHAEPVTLRIAVGE